MNDRALPSEDAEAGAIHKAQQGDLGAFNTLVLAHQEIAYRVAYRILGERDAAADAIQESFLKAYRKLGQLRGGSFRAWLLRIVVNTCYDLLRWQKRHPSCSLEGGVSGDEHEDRLPGGGESPEEFAIQRELNYRIQAALVKLPVDQRVVVILRDIEGLTYEEIAASTGTQLGTVKSRVSRGRSRLRDLLAVDAVPTGSRPAAHLHADGNPAGHLRSARERGGPGTTVKRPDASKGDVRAGRLKLMQGECGVVGSSLVRLTPAMWGPRFWLAVLAVLALVLGSLAGPRTVSAQQESGFDFSPIGDSRVTGYALVTAEGQSTNISIRLAGLGSNAPTQATLNAGSCAQPSADALWMLNLQWVDERGRGDGSGTVTVDGHSVALTDLADGQHLVVIRSAGQAVACGAIPALQNVDVPSTLLAEGEREQVMQFNPGAALQIRIFADGFVPNSAEFRSTLEGTTFAAQRAEHLGTGAVRVYFAREGDWGNVRFYQRGAPADALGRDLLDEAERHQAIRFNSRAAFQKAIFADGFVPNSGEFHLQLNGLTYTAQRAEDLRSGRVRVYCAVAGQWNKVSYAERPGDVAM